MTNKFQTVTGFITETFDHNGVDRLAVELLVDGAKDMFVYDVPADVVNQILSGGLPLGSLTMLRPYNSVLNNTFAWRQGVSKFVQGDASLLAQVESKEATPVMRDDAGITEAQAKARIEESKTKRLAAKADATTGTPVVTPAV
jgi:hypothetical protein